MARLSKLLASSLLSTFLVLTNAQDGTTTAAPSPALITTVIGGTTTSFRPIFTMPADSSNGAIRLPNIQDAQAIDAQTVCPGYKASHVQKNKRGFTAVLNLAGEPCNVYGNDVEVLKLVVEQQAAKRLSVNISPAYISSSNSSHYIIPESLLQRPKADSKHTAGDLQFDWGNEPSFWFKVTRQSTGDVLFTTEKSKLVFEDQFIEFVTELPNDYNISGLGERIHGLKLNNMLNATIYAADIGDPIDRNLYGSHPFYIETRYSEKEGEGYKTRGNGHPHGGKPYGGSKRKSYTHGVYLRNMHGQEILLRPDHLTWRTIGGSIDLFFFDGPTPAEAIREYQFAATGFPTMQPYWGFGYHQCRWGYRNWTETREIVDTMRAFNIPMETIWLDIDYMKDYQDFTVDPVTFPLSGVKEFFDKLHADHQHFVPIVDSAIYVPNPNNASDAYDTYTRGHESDVFLKNPDGSEYIGAVWPGYTVFPDWLSENGIAWWVKEMVEWHKEVPYSGFWIDMNEVSSFCVGSCGSDNVTMNQVHPPFSLPGEPGNIIYDYPEGFNVTNSTEAASASSAASSQNAAKSTAPAPSTSTTYLRTTPTPGSRNINYPPYVIDNVQGDLAVHAVAPNATHGNGVAEYDVHNIWGHQILNATYQGLLSVFPGKRPFIIGRSTVPGSGKWAGHWGGDNYSKWAYMYFSIPQALSFSIFGIPMFGVDTCGFNGNTDYELCSRWMQLSAFFPFYRNHNTITALPQEPFRWESVAEASRVAMHIRYSLLPYMYTLFHKASTTGSTVMRALAWEFPDDAQLAGVDTQFLLGPSIMVTPVLEPQADTVKAVFPGVADGQVWYDWYTQEKFEAEAGVNTTISAPLGHIPVFIRGGSVLPIQEPGYTTTESRQNPWSVLVALSEDGEACGELYVDDGESLKQEKTLQVSFEAKKGKLQVKVDGKYEDKNALDTVTVMGLDGFKKVKLNGKKIDDKNVKYSKKSKVLQIEGLKELTKEGAWKKGWTLSWE